MSKQSGSKAKGAQLQAQTKISQKAKGLSPITQAWGNYKTTVQENRRLQLVDLFLVFLFMVAVFQFGFCILGGSFPFNAFLGGFGLCVAQFVLTVSLRLQINKQRAFAEYIFASLLVHFVVLHFIN